MASACYSGSTPTEAPTVDTDWKEVFFWARRCTGQEVNGKLFIVSGEVEHNISKHGFSFYAVVLLNKVYKGIGNQFFVQYVFIFYLFINIDK